MKITCMITVYNEEARIGNFLEHATKWADEVVVRDKASTDSTVDICRSYGIEPAHVPFSSDGTWEMDTLECANNDWVFYMTASEIPTKKLIDKMRELIETRGDELDLVYIPKVLWSLGICSDKSPWHVSYQPFLINRKRAVISDRIHANFSAPKERTATIEREDGCFVAHLTHTSGEAFLRKHLEYAIHEVNTDESEDMIAARCVSSIVSAFDGVGIGHELWAQKCGWNVYFYSIMLLAAERGKDHVKTYGEIARKLIETNWHEQ